MNKLNKLIYVPMLESMSCVIKDDYQIVLTMSGQEFPVKVDNKLTYLATNESMAAIGNDRVFFHPACESITSKETEIDKVLRKLMSATIYRYVQLLPDVLIKIANKKTKTLSNKVLESLEPLKGINQNTRTEIMNILRDISMMVEVENVDTRIVNFILNKGGKTEDGDHIYYRCNVNFPFYTSFYRVLNQNSHLKDSDFLIFNEKKYSIKASKAVIALLELIIPSVKDTTRLESVATNSVAARMVAMVRSFSLICNDISSIIGKFIKDYATVGIYNIDMSWTNNLDELPDLVNLIPPLDYNSYNTKNETMNEVMNSGYNNFDPFSNSVSNTLTNNIVSNSKPLTAAPPAPLPRPGEVYNGCVQLSNGLYEYRFTNQSTGQVRVVCLYENGSLYSENYIGGQQQQYNTVGNGYTYTGTSGNGNPVPPMVIVLDSNGNQLSSGNNYDQNNGWGNTNNYSNGYTGGVTSGW